MRTDTVARLGLRSLLRLLQTYLFVLTLNLGKLIL
jgi:hypothetical protein